MSDGQRKATRREASEALTVKKKATLKEVRKQVCTIVSRQPPLVAGSVRCRYASACSFLWRGS